MEKNRLEAFGDGVIAIIITIMVLELKQPVGDSINDLWALAPTLLAYFISFLFIAIYWINHHHTFHKVESVNFAIIWCNIAWLFVLHTLRDGMGGNLSHVICASCCIFSGHDPCLHHIPSYVLGDHEGKQAEVQVERKKHSQSDNISRRRSLWRFLPHCGIYCCGRGLLLVDHTGEEKESVRRIHYVKEKRTGSTGLQDLRK